MKTIKGLSHASVFVILSLIILLFIISLSTLNADNKDNKLCFSGDSILQIKDPIVLYRVLKSAPAKILLLNKDSWKMLSNYGTVTTSYKPKSQSAIYTQDQTTGEWILQKSDNSPKRVIYSESSGNLKDAQSLNVEVLGRTFRSIQSYQEIGIIDGKRKVPIYGFKGCPFHLYDEPMQTTKVLKMVNPLKVLIDSASMNILWVSDKSACPFLFDNNQLSDAAFMAINVRWIFLKKNELFFAGNDAYLTLKDSASISFSSEGLKLSGIKKYHLENK